MNAGMMKNNLLIIKAVKRKLQKKSYITSMAILIALGSPCSLR
jgi:hypothetical protein